MVLEDSDDSLHQQATSEDDSFARIHSDVIYFKIVLIIW